MVGKSINKGKRVWRMITYFVEIVEWWMCETFDCGEKMGEVGKFLGFLGEGTAVWKIEWKWNVGRVDFYNAKPLLARPHALGVWMGNPHAQGVWVAGNFCCPMFSLKIPHGLGVWMCSPHALGVWVAEIKNLQCFQLSNDSCMNICCNDDICNDIWMELCSCKSH